MGNLKLAVTTNNGSSWATVWTKSGNQGNAWQSESVDLSSYAGGTVSLRFDGITGTTWQGDMAIDGISLTNVAADKCAGVPAYVSGQSYSVGDRVTYQCNLFERAPSSWTNLGPCGTARIDNEGSVEHLGVKISLYPNPVKGDRIFIQSNVENLSYRVISMLGKQVSAGISSQNGINVARLEAGVYFIKINNGDEVITKKFIKQ